MKITTIEGSFFKIKLVLSARVGIFDWPKITFSVEKEFCLKIIVQKYNKTWKHKSYGSFCDADGAATFCWSKIEYLGLLSARVEVLRIRAGKTNLIPDETAKIIPKLCRSKNLITLISCLSYVAYHM